MSRFRCFDTYNLKNTSSSDYITDRKRKTIFTEYQTIAIGNVNYQKGLTENVIPPGYLQKDNGAYYYGPVYVTTDDPKVNNCLIGAKNYELLYDVLFGAQPSPDDIKNLTVSYSGEVWQGNILKTDFKSIGNIGPAISDVPNGSQNKMDYAARQDFLPKYDDNPNPPDAFPGMVIDPSYNVFYPRCNTKDLANNYIKNVKFNFTAAQLENTELVNYIRLSSAKQYKQFPYQLNFQTTTCEKYPFSFVFSFTNNSNETAEQILSKYMPLINVDDTISYDIEYLVKGLDYKSLTFFINFKYTGAPSSKDGLTFYPTIPPTNDLVNFYNNFTTNLKIEKFDLIPLSPIGSQFKNLKFSISGIDAPLIKPNTSLDNAFRGTTITLDGNGINNWRTSGVTSMNSTFRSSNFNGELNNWNTSNVTNMVSIFEDSSFNKPISNWDIRKLTTMERMFYGATVFNQPLNGPNWNTINIKNMRNLFTGASSFDQSLNTWNTNFVTDMSGMFMNATSFNGNIRTWNAQSVLTMHSMFRNAQNFNQNISRDGANSYWNTTNVENFDYIFADTVKFNNGQTPLPFDNPGITQPLNWDNNDFTIFQTCINPTLNAVGLTSQNAYPFLKSSTFVYKFYDTQGTTSADICNNYLPVIINGSSKLNNVTIVPPSATAGIGTYRTVSFSLLYNGNDTNTGLTFYDPSDTKVNFYNTTNNTGSANPIRIINFDYIPLAKENGNQFYKLQNLDISSSSIIPVIYPFTNLSGAFNQAYNFNSNKLSNWNVSNAINMSSMFKDTSFNQDISGWVTSNVTNMSSMFENNIDFNQNISRWNTSKVTNMSNMFKNAVSFNSKLQYDTTDPSNIYWDVSSVTNMTSMFQNATSFNDGQGPGGITQPLNWILKPIVILTNVRTGATTLTNQNAYPLPSLYTLIYEFYNQPVQTDEDISNNVPILIASPSSTIISTTVSPSTLANYKTVSTTASFPNHIQDLSSGISFINVYTFFNSSNAGNPHIITQFGGMPLARNDNSGTPNGYQFANLTSEVDFSANDVPSILPNTTLSYCFYNNNLFNSRLNWDTSAVTSMASMFELASAFDQSLNFITNKVTNMANMFKGATVFNKQISYYTGGPYWDVSSVTNMTSIFENASTFNNGYAPLDITHPLNWILNLNVNTTNCITNATNLTFENAYPLAQIYDRFNYTFYNTQNLSVQDISNSYLPIIKTSDINLNYYYPPSITINPLDNSFTTVTVYFRYNDICANIIDGLSFNNVYSTYNSNSHPKTITNFGKIPLARNNGSGIGNQFANINNLVFNSPVNPTITPNTTFNSIFKNSNFNSDISGWNTSNVASLNSAFNNTLFNKSINNWNTSNVTDMSGVFYNDLSFNSPLSNWNVSNVTSMSNMFYNCQVFNQDISGWQTSKLNTINGMFENCQLFNQYLSKWDLSGVTTMDRLFYKCFNFNNGDAAGLSNNPLYWNTSKTTIMSNMFFDAMSFNQDISGWKTGNVTTMSNMFNGAEVFNQPIYAWDVSNVKYMDYMFYNTTFNQDISGWNTSSLTTMESMFQNDISFNYRISYIPSKSTTAWNTSNVTNMKSVFEGALNFNNGQGQGGVDQSLNWILNPTVNTTRAVTNTPLLTLINALPLSKVIIGNFTYTFYNTNDALNSDISNNYLPIYDSCGNLTILSPALITTPDITQPKLTRVDISYSFIDPTTNTFDGLTFYDYANNKTTFYNDTSNRVTILNFDGIPLSRNNGYGAGYQFANLSYLDISVNQSDKPTISLNTSFDYTFYNTPSFNSGNIQYWDTISVNSMKSMFQDSSFNQPLRFNTINVINMNSMFKNASNFNQNISYNPLLSTNIWNVSNVTDMSGLLMGATSFNDGQSVGGTTQPLNWTLNPSVNITNVRRDTPVLTNQNASPLPSIYTLKYDFYDNSGVSGNNIISSYAPIILNGKSSFYNTSVIPSSSATGNKSVSIELAYVTDNVNTGLSFYSSGNTKTSFYNQNNNIPLKITQLDGIPLSRNNGLGDGYQFANLNRLDFSTNDVPLILPNTTLSYGFYNDTYFNSDISGWNVSEVTSMASLFENDGSFNKPLQPWNTSKVTNMSNMFKNASSFNQTVKYIPSSNYWDVSSVSNMNSIFENALSFNNGFPLLNVDNSLNWILNGGITKINAVLNTPSLTDYNGLPLTTLQPNEFIYKFYNTNSVAIGTIVSNYLPFIKTGYLDFDINKNVSVTYGPLPFETTIKIRFTFTDNGTTLDGLTFNSTPSTAVFYNQTGEPVEIIKFGGMPLSRYYKNAQQSLWYPSTGTTFNVFGYNVTYANSNWVAVGGYGAPIKTILHSSNGINWNTVTGVSFDGLGYAVSYGSGKWIAVGDDYGGTSTILESTNNSGTNWADVSGTTFSYAGYGVAYDGSSRWVAVGDDNGGPNTILTTTTGTWNTVTGAFTVAGFGVTYGGGRWVAVGAGTRSILYSNTGTSWTACSGAQFSSYGQSVIYNGTRWVAIGNDNGGTNTILYSDDGITWVACSGTKMSSYAQGLAYGGGRWIAVGYDNGGTNTILYSDDGITWNRVSGLTFAFAGYGVSYDISGSRWVAVGDNNGSVNTILISNDGINWFSAKGTRFDLVGYGVDNNGGLWSAVGYDTDANNILYSSNSM